jgi:predicted DNA-binding transcriptional regulator AlpA
MAVAGKIVHYSPPESGAQLIAPADILTPKQLADRLQVPVSWIYKHCSNERKRKLPVLRCDGFLRFDWAEVSAWLRQNRKA